MSTIFLHVGQCGNQLGHAFWQEVQQWSEISPPRSLRSRDSVSAVGKHRPESNSKKKLPGNSSRAHTPYSLLDGTFPCILLDTEIKVVRKCTAIGTLLGSKVSQEFRLVEKEGRGSNWAYGYFSATRRNEKKQGLTEQERLVDKVQQCVRRLVEKCDRFGGFIHMHSISGGTGSGDP